MDRNSSIQQWFDDLSQQQIAELLGIDQSSVSRMFSDRRFPPVENLTAAANWAGISLDEMVRLFKSRFKEKK